jgi:hypothetical protein
MKDYSTLTPKEASALIAECVKKAEQAVSEAEAIADATGIGFRLDLGGYGMGGYNNPEPIKPSDAEEDWEASDEDYGWQASSQSC